MKAVLTLYSTKKCHCILVSLHLIYILNHRQASLLSAETFGLQDDDYTRCLRDE